MEVSYRSTKTNALCLAARQRTMMGLVSEGLSGRPGHPHAQMPQSISITSHRRISVRRSPEVFLLHAVSLRVVEAPRRGGRPAGRATLMLRSRPVHSADRSGRRKPGLDAPDATRQTPRMTKQKNPTPHILGGEPCLWFLSLARLAIASLLQTRHHPVCMFLCTEFRTRSNYS